MRIKTTLSLLLLLPTLAEGALYSLNGVIDGAQANAGAGTGSSATGMIMGSYDDATNLLEWSISWNAADLVNGSGSENAMHFHNAPAGSNGGVAIGIGVGSNPATGSSTLTGIQETDLLANNWYVNLHTTAFPGGEIRGQVLTTVIPEPSSFALLSLCGLSLLARRKR